jgi:hypothetical protein
MEREEIEDLFFMLADDGFYEYARERSLELADAFRIVREYSSALTRAWKTFEEMGIVLSHRVRSRIGQAALLEWENGQ